MKLENITLIILWPERFLLEQDNLFVDGSVIWQPCRDC